MKYCKYSLPSCWFVYWNVSILFLRAPRQRYEVLGGAREIQQKYEWGKKNEYSPEGTAGKYGHRVENIDFTVEAAYRQVCQIWSLEGRVLRHAGRWDGTTVGSWRQRHRRCPRFLWKRSEIRLDIHDLNPACFQTVAKLENVKQSYW